MNAYLDPASGSMLLSAIAGGIAGIAVVIKTFGRRIFSVLAFWKKDDAQPASDESSKDEEPASDEPSKVTESA